MQYICCIKPNLIDSATEFERAEVLEQLRESGLIESLQTNRVLKIEETQQVPVRGVVGGSINR